MNQTKLKQKSVTICLTALLSLNAASLQAAAQTAAQLEGAMGFEVEGAWHSAPPEVLAVKNPSFLWSSHEQSGKNWKVEKTSLAELDGGLQLSRENVREGRFSGLWKDHARYPTIACRAVPRDWSTFNSIEISIYSAIRTDETVTMGVLSDSTGTPWKDFYLRDFVIDWKGWKTVRLPLKSFQSYEQPSGWSKIDGIYFFSKIFRRQPNPYTVLYLDALHLLTQEFTQESGVSATTAGDSFIYQNRYEDQALPLNHPFPETAHPQAFTGPIVQQSYFRTEGDLFKYYPRFNSGYPSFNAQGKAYINTGDAIEYLDGAGRWAISDIKAALSRWGKEQGWKGLYNTWGIQGADPMIRFDRAGDAYVLEQVEALNEKGERFDWKTRSALLLHSRDGMKSWTIYKLPRPVASFEKLDGHNQDCLNRPPVILLGPGYGGTDRSTSILIPEKQTDGSLRLPDPVLYATSSLGVNYHSGDGNVAITHGDTVFIVYGWAPNPALPSSDASAAMPRIPPDHPGLRQQFMLKAHAGLEPQYSKNGVPTYVVAYNIKTRQVSEPVYVGSGGGQMDIHNFPAITLDGKGILHVIINGHHNPANYTHSLRPYDISAWSAPEYVMAGTTLPNLSYATLTCDSDNTLYTVQRSTKDLYDNHLGFYRKRAGADWEEERAITAPFKSMYKVWYQRMSYNPARNRLFLTYFSNGGQEWYTWDMLEFYAFFWPDKEKAMYSGSGAKSENNPGRVAPGSFAGATYTPGATQITTLVSNDQGTTWHLATTEDFKASENPL